MRLVFAGTPEFARAFLEELYLMPQHEVVAVYSQPDRPAGRGKHLRPSPVKEFAQKKGIPVIQPQSLKETAAQQTLAAWQPDLMVVVAYGLILPPEVLQIPVHGCINVHASLLPRWRGAAPIHRAIAAGDTKSGVAIMRMDADLDTGDVLAEAQLNIDPAETTGSLHDKLIELGRPLLRQVVDQIPDIFTSAKVQDDSQATYAKKILSAEAAINWNQSAREIDCWVRALNPAPGAFTLIDGERVKVWQTTPLDGCGKPGEILAISSEGVEVASGQGSLQLQRLQLAGKSPMDAAEVVRGHPQTFVPGKFFDTGTGS